MIPRGNGRDVPDDVGPEVSLVSLGEPRSTSLVLALLGVGDAEAVRRVGSGVPSSGWLLEAVPSGRCCAQSVEL